MGYGPSWQVGHSIDSSLRVCHGELSYKKYNNLSFLVYKNQLFINLLNFLFPHMYMCMCTYKCVVYGYIHAHVASTFYMCIHVRLWYVYIYTCRHTNCRGICNPTCTFATICHLSKIPHVYISLHVFYVSKMFYLKL